MNKRVLFFAVFLGLASGAGNAKSEIFSGEKEVIGYQGAEIEITSNRTLLHNGKVERYSVRNLFDNNLNTAWVTKLKSNEEYDYFDIQIEFKKPEYLKSISVANGYQKSKNTYLNNQRAKSIQIATKIAGHKEYNDWLDYEYSLNDDKNFQEVLLKNVLPFKLLGLKIRINSEYGGNKYDDLCISEIKLNIDDINPYEPVISGGEFKEIMQNKIDKFLVNDKQCWDFNASIKNDPRNINIHEYGKFLGDLESDLFYYAIKGESNYRDAYESYCPRGAATSEWFEGIVRPAMEAMLNPNEGEI